MAKTCLVYMYFMLFITVPGHWKDACKVCNISMYIHIIFLKCFTQKSHGNSSLTEES